MLLALLVFSLIAPAADVSLAEQRTVTLTTTITSGSSDELRAGKAVVGNADYGGAGSWNDYQTVTIPDNSLIVGGSLGIGTDEYVVDVGTDPAAIRLVVHGAVLKDYVDVDGDIKRSLMYGENTNTHINMGTSSKTGLNGQDYSYCTVGGGEDNTASHIAATVGGGENNMASGQYSTVMGGTSSIASGDYSTIGGGSDNTASGLYATVVGGQNNTASGNYATVVGGQNNIASHLCTTVAGGSGNQARSPYSWVFGNNMKIDTSAANGVFVWGHSTGVVTISPTSSAFIIYSGKVAIGSSSVDPSARLYVNGKIKRNGTCSLADYVFEPGYKLESVEEHTKFMWENKHLPAIPKMEKTEDGRDIISMDEDQKGILEELEKAHIYIAHLKKTLDEQERKIAMLEKEMILGIEE